MLKLALITAGQGGSLTDKMLSRQGLSLWGGDFS